MEHLAKEHIIDSAKLVIMFYGPLSVVVAGLFWMLWGIRGKLDQMTVDHKLVESHDTTLINHSRRLERLETRHDQHHPEEVSLQELAVLAERNTA